MVRFGSGLIVTPSLTSRNVSVDMHFEPSVGILARKVDKLGLDIRSFREPLKRVVKQVMIPSIRKNFDSGGRPEWEELSLGTVEQKGGDDRPLIRTGALRRQMGYINTWTIDREKAMIVDLPQKVWYGKVHQAGGSFSFRTSGASQNLAAIKSALSFSSKFSGTESSFGGSGEIPARPFVVVQEEDLVKMDRVFNEWLGERIAHAGLGGRSRR